MYNVNQGWDPMDSFEYNSNHIVRRTSAGRFSGTAEMARDDVTPEQRKNGEPAKVWALARLRGSRPRYAYDPQRCELRVVDLCCGVGGLCTGFKWACKAVNMRAVVSLAVDVDAVARRIYSQNLRPLEMMAENIVNLVDYDQKPRTGTARLQVTRPELHARVGEIDVLLAGPPCEGNSNFNNHTRRSDRRNELYVTSVAIGIAMGARVLVLENVVAVLRSRQNVIDRAVGMLIDAGYEVNSRIVLDASRHGTAQARRRHCLLAHKDGASGRKLTIGGLMVPPLAAMDAIGDLVDVAPNTIFDQPPNLSSENQLRVHYLHDNDVYDLPNDERPDCHRLKSHSYRAVYGRMYPNEPSQTITTGFLSPGRGRFVHPTQRRGLTPHEGARLQGFPDDYKWYPPGHTVGRNALAHLIGDAVPPQLGYVAGLLALSRM